MTVEIMCANFRVLLPPSETKAAGGDGASLDYQSLFLPEFEQLRRQAVTAVIEASVHPDAASNFKLGPKLRSELEVNRSLNTAGTMPALSRYSGVLYDEIPVASLSAEQWNYVASHLVIHSALFGPLGAGDLIPNYRLRPELSLPNFSVKKHWRGKATNSLAESASFFIDLRAKNYRALAPLPAKSNQVYLEIVAEDASGRKRALNHFNKKTKGQLIASLLKDRPRFSSIDDFGDWLAAAGWRSEKVDQNNWQLISS